MEINEVVSLLSFVTTCIVGIILYRQIQSQKQIIQNLKTYSEIIDVEKIKKLVEFQHQTTINAAKTFLKEEVIEMLKPKLKEAGNEMKDLLLASMGDQFNELAEFAFEYIMSLPEKEQRAFIREYFVHNKDIFLKAQETAINEKEEIKENKR
jgi:hypothetical protein